MTIPDLQIPRKFATVDTYVTGPAVGTASKADPGAGLAGSGIIPGAAYPAQHINFTLNGLTRAARRHLTTLALRLSLIDTTVGGAPADTASSCGAAMGTPGVVVLAKSGATGANKVVDSASAVPATAVSSITSLLSKIVNNGSVMVAIGTGGNLNAKSTNNGATWAAGGSTGLASAPADLTWNATQSLFILANGAGGSAASVTGAAWFAGHVGSDISDTLTGGFSGGFATLGSATFACGTITNVAFVKSTTNLTNWTSTGGTWSNTGGTIPTPANYGNAGSLAGFNGTEIYWLGHDVAHTTTNLSLFVSTDGITWTQRASIGGYTLGTPQPLLLQCPNTGMLVAVCIESTGMFALSASFDRGFTWTELVRVNASTNAGFAIAGGRLFMTKGAQLFASAGIGLDF